MTDNGHAMLTTIDNPWSPFTHYDEWYAFDEEAGYCTTGLIARVAYTSEEISDADQEVAVNEAIDEIIQENVSGVHRKVYANS